jgi:trimethylamine:corrinoid methyltransferase-like protein
VDSKLPDAQAAAESMETLLMVSLAGMTMCQSLGTLAFGMYGSPEMAVMCDEMVYTIKRITDGFAVNDDTLALDVIRKAGFEGNFLKQAHTASHFRKEMFFPSLFRRQTSEEWVKAGSKAIDQVAHEKVLEILEKAGPIVLPVGADAELERALKQAIDNHPA